VEEREKKRNAQRKVKVSGKGFREEKKDRAGGLLGKRKHRKKK